MADAVETDAVEAGSAQAAAGEASAQAPSPDLLALADAYGIAAEYDDWRDRHVHVPAATLVAVLRAFGVDAANPARAAAALAERRLAPWRRMLPPTVVVREGRPGTVDVHVPHGHRIEIWAELEDGGVLHDLLQHHHLVPPRSIDGEEIGEARFGLPAELPCGWHRLHARAYAPDAGPDVPPSAAAVATLIVVPDRLELPSALEHDRGWGFMAQLYAVPSRRSWGVGDLQDLADLAAWSGQELGADFVLINPLHAHAPVPPIEPSPYLPASRRYADPLYLRVEAVPEYAYLPEEDRARVAAAAATAREGAAASERCSPPVPLIDRDRAWAAKDAALRLVHRVPRGPGREAAFRAFTAHEGDALLEHATWCVLAEEYGLPWRSWPRELTDPRSPEVAALRERLAERVDYHCWLQWVLDEQLDAAQRAAERAGMGLGVLHDLAVGVDPGGADAWALADVLATGIHVGAPPDAYTQHGQDWNQPPWRPDRLAETAYAPFRHIVRAVLRHGGGVRVDHVMGLFRLWWIPDGMRPSEGTYVYYDHEALVGILALEARRAAGPGGVGDALVIGEDLGTVEPHVREHLVRRGILGTSILWFEQDGRGQPVPPERWRSLCLATVTTHDLPPTRGLLDGDHVELRHRFGLLTRSLDEERAEHEAVRGGWLHLARTLALLPPDAEERRVVEALHRMLVRAPSKLVGVYLPDAVGDRRVQNMPGTSDEYPNWRVPLAGPDGEPLLLEDLVRSARLRSLVEAVRSG